MSRTTIRGRSFDGTDVDAELDHGSYAFVTCSLRDAHFGDGDWSGSTFEDCDFSGTRFSDSDLSETSWLRCRGEQPVFGNADLTDARFEACDFVGVRYASVTAADTVWTGCKLLNATFVDLRGFGWEIASCVLMYADMRGVSFRKRTLREIDFTEADLRDADFREAIFERCKLVRADIRGADFAAADVRDADMGPLDDLARLAALKGAMISDVQARAVASALGLVVV